jgi:hypothetical protein
MNQYIITEEVVCSGCDMCNKDVASKNKCSILFSVRSHPYQSEQKEPWCYPGCILIDRAKKNERDKVLDAFKEVIRLHDEDELLYPDLYNEFLVIYKSQWKQAGEP